MKTFFVNIKELIQVRDTSVKKVSGKTMNSLPSIKNSFLLIENDRIIDFGKMEQLPNLSVDDTKDCAGKMILPTWCDSHTHIVFAGNREQEFVDRINGLSYEEIANNGGGVLNSAKKLQATSEGDLYAQSAKRLEEVIALGTGAFEIKSGYGLTLDAELKMRRVIKKLKENYNIPIKATFLGAHAIPSEFKSNKEGYINLIIEEMLPKIAAENLADFVDAFCEVGYFSVDDTDRILTAAEKYNVTPKVHVNQFNSICGIAVSTKHKALSVDHLEVLTDDDLTHLKASETIPVALPSCSFFLGITYTPARKIIDANLPLALATDYNPGSTPSGNMNFVIATACIKMKMTPEEAINAATINGAFAMNVSNKVGSITKGKLANFMITKEIPSYGFIPYSFGSNLIDEIYINGNKF
ncbi:MAG: imidazolonepropionase [Polaribacter sp.]|jgi:imidazolonepropionase